MIVMPIVNKAKNGNVIIHNVEIRLKNASKVKEGINLKSYREGDIIINNSSFNNSIYNIKNKKPNSTVNFIRNSNYREGRNDFLITQKKRNKDDSNNSNQTNHLAYVLKKVAKILYNICIH